MKPPFSFILALTAVGSASANTLLQVGFEMPFTTSTPSVGITSNTSLSSIFIGLNAYFGGTQAGYFDNITVTSSTPEPAAISLMATALTLCVLGRKRLLHAKSA